MNRVALTPPNELAWKAMRVLDVTSTESAALFGMSPYTTTFHLWHAKRAQTPSDFEPSERMEWGTDLQDSIALSFARRYGVKVVRVTEYMRIEQARMGSSFDFEIVDMADVVAADTSLQEMFKQHGPGILEIKNVDRSVFRDAWERKDAETGERWIEPPGHIDIQLQHQLHVRERGWGALGVLVGGNTGKLVLRERRLDVGNALQARIEEFWRSVDEGREPEPAYPGDAEFVAKLYGYAEVGRVYDGRGNAELAAILAEYCEAAGREKMAKEDKKVAQAKALRIIGDAERAIIDGYSVSAGMVGPTHVEYDRKGYRNWRVTPKKGV